MSDYMPPNAYRLYARTAEALAKCIGGAPKGLDTEQFELLITISRETSINPTDSRALHTYIRRKLDAHAKYMTGLGRPRKEELQQYETSPGLEPAETPRSAAMRRLQLLVREYGSTASIYELMLKAYDDPLCKAALEHKEIRGIIATAVLAYMQSHHDEILNFLVAANEPPTDF